jgi:periplasmic mercuric ion binding protein
MKKLLLFCFLMIFAQALCAQAAPKKTGKLQSATFMVLGNCSMCKKTIETAAKKAGAVSAEWDMSNDLLKVMYASKKTSKDAIQKAVAQAGYDNAGYKADDESYENLHGCCQYDRTGKAGGTKSCTAN